jgi:hypothetical protein
MTDWGDFTPEQFFHLLDQKRRKPTKPMNGRERAIEALIDRDPDGAFHRAQQVAVRENNHCNRLRSSKEQKFS